MTDLGSGSDSGSGPGLRDGQLVASRVHADPGGLLADVLDRGLTGYARIEPQPAMLADGDPAVLVFDAGVPTMAYHPATDAGGSDALAAIGTPGPYRAELYALAPDALPDPAADPALSVAPGTPAERLAADRDLAARTRRVAPEARGTPDSAVEAFLADEGAVESLQEGARREAERRAEEWGLDGSLQ